MILIQAGKALQALYVGSILNEMAAGIMDAEEGAEEVERMFLPRNSRIRKELTKMSKEKIEMTEKQFEELCKAVYPHLKAIQEALKGNGEEMSASISVGSDGYLNFHPYNSDWELSKFKDSQATMKYEHRTILKMEEDE